MTIDILKFNSADPIKMVGWIPIFCSFAGISVQESLQAVTNWDLEEFSNT
uniref:Uncharacterized protein n=1 Tax=Octopus bimaculoides TaxID=37653 RepID=A0A0L8GY29_OCTBM